MHLGQFSMGAGGLVFTEATHVSPEGRITPKCLGLWSDDNERTLKRVVDFCKAHGVAKMGIQIAHAGRKASNRTPLKIGRAHVCTTVTNATLACRLLLETKNKKTQHHPLNNATDDESTGQSHRKHTG